MAGRVGRSCSCSALVPQQFLSANLLLGGETSPLSGEEGITLGVAW